MEFQGQIYLHNHVFVSLMSPTSITTTAMFLTLVKVSVDIVDCFVKNKTSDNFHVVVLSESAPLTCIEKGTKIDLIETLYLKI